MLIDLKFDMDGYEIGDRLLEGTSFTVNVVFDTDKIEENKDFMFTVKSVMPSNKRCEKYLESLGGPGAVTYWCDKVSEEIKGYLAGRALDYLEEDIQNHPVLSSLFEKYGYA